jgi:polysaccharide deacetylase 2 family uncharacterized protein YibQ
MSDFRAVLDEEVANAVDDSIKKNHAPKVKWEFNFLKYFSFLSFLKSSVFLGAIFGVLLGWVYLNAEKTKTSFKDRLASKTVTIERGTHSEVFTVAPPTTESEHNKIFYEASNTLDSSETANQENNNINTSQVSPVHSGALTPAPVPGLYESLTEGIIPKARLEDGMTPFKAYKKPFTPVSAKPKISLVAVNVGMSRNLTQEAIRDLPSEISLGFSPYAPNVKLLSDAARTAGHETWLMLPLQNENYPLNDPGPATLLTMTSIEQNQARLLSLLGRAVGYVGLISWEDHIYTPKDAETSSVIPQIFGRGLAVLDSAAASNRDFGRRAAYNDEFPFLKNNFWLDQNLVKGHMETQFKRVQDLASARGEAVMLFHPYPKSINAVKNWINSPQAREFELVPASYLAQYKDE